MVSIGDKRSGSSRVLSVAFIRVAFGDRLSFPSTYYCMAADGRISGEYPLSEQPIFMQAMTAARAADRHTLVTIMERGAEFSAINKAVSAGHKAKTLELSHLCFFGPPDLHRANHGGRSGDASVASVSLAGRR